MSHRSSNRIHPHQPGLGHCTKAAVAGTIADHHQRFWGTHVLSAPVICRKPNTQEFVRVHPEIEMLMPLLYWQRDNELYYVEEEFLDELASELIPYTLHLAVNNWGNVFLWPIKYGSESNKRSPYWKIQDQAAKKAKEKWVRITGYSKNTAKIIATTDYRKNPIWPKDPIEELLELAFLDFTINDLNHPVLILLKREVNK